MRWLRAERESRTCCGMNLNRIALKGATRNKNDFADHYHCLALARSNYAGTFRSHLGLQKPYSSSVQGETAITYEVMNRDEQILIERLCE